MAAATKALGNLRYFAQQLAGILELEEKLAKVGSLEKYEKELGDQVEQLKVAHQTATDDLAATEETIQRTVDKAKGDAEAIVKAAKETSDTTLASAAAAGNRARAQLVAAEVQANQTKADATAEAGRIIAAARREAAAVRDDTLKAKADLDKVQSEVSEAEAKKVAVVAEIERLKSVFRG